MKTLLGTIYTFNATAAFVLAAHPHLGTAASVGVCTLGVACWARGAVVVFRA